MTEPMLVVLSGNLLITAGLPPWFSLSTSLVTWVVLPDLSQPSKTISAPLLIALVIFTVKIKINESENIKIYNSLVSSQYFPSKIGNISVTANFDLHFAMLKTISTLLKSINQPRFVLVSVFCQRQVIMYRELVTTRLSLVERDNIEHLLSGDDTRYPDNTRLVAHDQTTVARLTHAAPGRLGQVGRGQD